MGALNFREKMALMVEQQRMKREEAKLLEIEKSKSRAQKRAEKKAKAEKAKEPVVETTEPTEEVKE